MAGGGGSTNDLGRSSAWYFKPDGKRLWSGSMGSPPGEAVGDVPLKAPNA